MARYIDGEHVKEILNEDVDEVDTSIREHETFFVNGLERAIHVIDKAPTADVQPVNQWISVKDRLPNEDDCYLVVIESEICVSIDIAEYSENRWHKHDKVLYWQPLPEPPKDGDAE